MDLGLLLPFFFVNCHSMYVQCSVRFSACKHRIGAYEIPCCTQMHNFLLLLHSLTHSLKRRTHTSNEIKRRGKVFFSLWKNANENKNERKCVHRSVYIFCFFYSTSLSFEFRIEAANGQAAAQGLHRQTKLYTEIARK